jgi:predicted Rossmann fold nucleotide-binding protein DprA/Smf involved in DNA uptake
MSDVCANKHGGNEESNAANKKVDPFKAAMRELIYQAVVKRGPSTADEIVTYLGMPYQTVSGRFSDLKIEGRLVRTGERRMTRRNCTAAVFAAAEKEDA